MVAPSFSFWPRAAERYAGRRYRRGEGLGTVLYAALLDGTIGVYDIDAQHRTHRLFLSYVSSTGGHIVCVDLLTDAVPWRTVRVTARAAG